MFRYHTRDIVAINQKPAIVKPGRIMCENFAVVIGTSATRGTRGERRVGRKEVITLGEGIWGANAMYLATTYLIL